MTICMTISGETAARRRRSTPWMRFERQMMAKNAMAITKVKELTVLAKVPIVALPEPTAMAIAIARTATTAKAPRPYFFFSAALSGRDGLEPNEPKMRLPGRPMHAAIRKAAMAPIRKP